MAKTVPGLNVTGRFKESGVTIYLRNGKPVARTATSWQPKRRTRKQFIARQQMLHSTRLWAFLKYAGTPMFPALPTAYARFLSLMHRTEVQLHQSDMDSTTTVGSTPPACARTSASGWWPL